MKTLQELYNEVTASEELKKEYIAAANDGKALGFISEHGVDATKEEIKAFFEELSEKDSELSDEETENVAGGGCSAETGAETVISMISAGVGCAFAAIVSSSTDGRYVGNRKEGDGRLCNHESHGLFD